MQNVGTSDNLGAAAAGRDILAVRKPATQKLSLVGKAASTKLSVVKTGTGKNVKTSQVLEVTKGATAGTKVGFIYPNCSRQKGMVYHTIVVSRNSMMR